MGWMEFLFKHYLPGVLIFVGIFVVIGIIVAIIKNSVEKHYGVKECPYCKGMVSRDATQCYHCNYRF